MSLFFKQAIENTPRERAVATTALEREIYRLRSHLGRVPDVSLVMTLVHQILSCSNNRTITEGGFGATGM